MAPSGNERVVEVMVESMTDVQAKLQTMNDVLNVMDWAIESALEELEGNGGIASGDEGLLQEYKKAIRTLRKRGFTRPRTAGKGVQCPGCQAMLKNVSGKPGERCDWCGYVFS